MLSNKNILVTGGAGFVGTALTKRICQNNRVVIFDNLHRNAMQDTGLVQHTNVALIKGDVLDPQTLMGAARACTHIVHMASIAGVDSVLKDPLLTMKVNYIGTHNVLEAARSEGTVERVVHFSTSEVFGQYAYKVTEEHATSFGAVAEARWTYAVSKLAAEHLAFNYHKTYGLPVVSVRPFNIYGPMQVGEGAIHHLTVRALRGEDLEIHNEGSQIRSWCYIDDMVDATLLALENKEAPGEVFNIGNPRSTLTIYHLAQLIIQLSRSTSQLRFVERNIPDVQLRIPSIEKAKRLLGYSPKVELEEGLLKTIEWYRRRLSS